MRLLLTLTLLLALVGTGYATDSAWIDRDGVTTSLVLTPANLGAATAVQGALADTSLQAINATRPPYNADRTGATDTTTALTSAISAASALGGGTVYLPQGTYKFTPPLILPPNVRIVGDGNCAEDNCTAATTLSVGTTYNGPAISIGTGTVMQYGNGIESVNIDLNDKARGAVYLNAAVGGRYKNIFVNGAHSGSAPTYAQYGYFLTATATTGTAINTMYNTFEGIRASIVNNILKFGYSSGGNVCHNSFTNLGGGFYVDGLDLVGSDNNNFSMTYLFARPGATGYGVKITHGAANDSAYFYQLQSDRGMYLGSNTAATVFGYDRTNGQPSPTLQDATAKISWTTDAANSDGWHLSGDINVLASAKFKDGTLSKTLAELAAQPPNSISCGAGNHVSSYDPVSHDFTCTSDTSNALGSTDANAVHVNTSGEIAGITVKASPSANDWIVLEDSAAGNAKKSARISTLPFGTVTAVSSANADITVTNGSTTPALTLNSGSGANQIAKLNGDAGLDLADTDWLAGTGTVSAAGTSNLTANTAGSFAAVKAGASIKFSNNTIVEVLSKTDDTTLVLAQNTTVTALTWTYRNPAITVKGNGVDYAYIKADGNLQLKGDGTARPRIYMHAWGGNPVIFGMRANGTPASPTGIVTDDTLFAINAGGYTSAGIWSIVPGVSVKGSEAWATGATGSYLEFNTTATGTATNSVKLRINPGGMQTEGLDDKTASFTVSNSTSRITLATGTATATLPKTLPAGTTSVLVTVAGAAASGVSFAAESGGSLSWGDAGAPTFVNSKTADVVCTSENAAATTAAAWRCVKGGDF